MRFEPTPGWQLEQVTPLRPSPVRAWLGQWAREMAPFDWVVLVYNVALVLLALQGSGPAWAASVGRTVVSLGGVALVLGLVRGGIVGGARGGLMHRLAIYGSVQLSYFTLRDLLPTATGRRLDEELYRLDVAIFGVEPTLWLDRYVAPATTEWFSFFYFSYFFVLAVHVLPMLFVERRERLVGEFVLGVVGVFCVSQLLYFAVPGYGPYHHLRGQFQHPLPSGTWFDMVQSAVAAGGALLDIFPSLHTGGPLYMALFSFRHRDLLPFRYTWPVALFFSLNIIVATLFLRWHYAVDVVAGIAMASAWAALAPRWGAYEARRRERRGARTPLWLALTEGPIGALVAARLRRALTPIDAPRLWA